MRFRAKLAVAVLSGRLNTWVTTGAALALARLARHHGVTHRAMLERLIAAADDAVATLEPDAPGWTAYFGRTAGTGGRGVSA
ncbi:MAG: hypothetical protein JOY66_18125 [Acetobacteraceae bacterium]|nr:hypothetical protein [Acetobacteraceae bacterium]